MIIVPCARGAVNGEMGELMDCYMTVECRIPGREGDLNFHRSLVSIDKDVKGHK